jgi:hypothetical protein
MKWKTIVAATFFLIVIATAAFAQNEVADYIYGTLLPYIQIALTAVVVFIVVATGGTKFASDDPAEKSKAKAVIIGAIVALVFIWLGPGIMKALTPKVTP